MYSYVDVENKVHRLVPSKFPPISLFDWAETQEELKQIAALEGFTNERISSELGKINLVSKEDWVGGEGSTPLMAAFTHIGCPSRFSDGSFGVYYAAETLQTAIRETIFHRERFFSASSESACSISMREYIAELQKPLIDITESNYSNLLNPDPEYYKDSQEFAKEIRDENHWGIFYPSVRKLKAKCVAIFRPPALTIPVQGCHLKYIWDGSRITEVYEESKIKNF